MSRLYPSLIRLVEQAIQSHVQGYSSGIFPGHEEGWPRLGRHFSLQKDGCPVIIYPWFGVYDTALGPIIYIGFDGRVGWCQPVYEAVRTDELPEGKTYRRPYKDPLRLELCFVLKEEKLDWLRSTGPVEKHQRIFLDFFAEVIRDTGEYLA